MSPEEKIQQAALAFGEARSISDLRVLIDTWAPRFHEPLRDRITSGPRPALGMEIARLPGRGGLTARRGGRFVVGIGADGRYVRRFTLAHELAHVLLHASQKQRALVLGEDEEERLCEFFAQRALAPPRLVAEYLARSGMPSGIAEVVELARSFRISLRASLVVLQECLPDRWPVVFVAATWRGHPKREEVLGLRIDTSAADGRFFVPVDTRLSKLGLAGLEDAVISADIGIEVAGRESVTLRSGQAGVSNWTATEAGWSATVHKAAGSRGEVDRRSAICALDISQIEAVGPRRRPRVPKLSSRRASIPEIPGQSQLNVAR